MAQDPFAEFKAKQREGWSFFAPLEAMTTPTAAHVVRAAGIGKGDAVLDVGCGTGVVALTAAQAGAKVTGLDLTPALLERAHKNASIAGVEVKWIEGDVEAMQLPDASFDVVVSQFGHMFAPRPDVAIGEMLRVLKPGGRIAFATWPPEHFIGLVFALVGRNLPPPPGAAPPPQWGDPGIVRERLGDRVTDLQFERGVMWSPCLSVQHSRELFEATAGPVIKLVQQLTTENPAKLAQFRADAEALIRTYRVDNQVKQDYLITRARKKA